MKWLYKLLDDKQVRNCDLEVVDGLVEIPLDFF